MPVPTKRWQVYPPLPDSLRARFPHLSPLVLQILYNRGITDAAEVETFLGGRLVFDNPFRLQGMNEAVARIRQAVGGGEPIAVYGDFDADGVTATALLTQTLEALGAQVQPYIPHRVDEGYGLNKGALSKLARQGVRLVITVDCGIRSVEDVAHARQQGLDVIVTDHHSVGPELPLAVAAINPKRKDCPYPFKELAGVGVAFKLAQALLRVESSMRRRGAPAIPLREEDLLDLVAVGTVADVVPLLGENRHLVQRGLERLNPSPPQGPEGQGQRYDYPQRTGLRALMQKANVKPGKVSAMDIGFRLGPRLNAAGRLESAMLSYDLLRTTDDAVSGELAQKLDDLNRRRQKLTLETQEQARAQIEEEGADAFLHLVAREDILAGIAGLVAGRLTEELYRPTVVVEWGQKLSRGSARSIPEFNITAALDRCGDLLERHGGHAAAAGFTVKTKNLPLLKARLQEIAAEKLAEKELTPTLSIDAEVRLDELNWATYELLQQFEPCGYANPAPLFLSRSVQVRDRRRVGSDGKHLRLTLSDGGTAWDGIAFQQGEWAEGMPERIDVAYTLEVNEWNDRLRLQLNVQDLQPSTA
ncbi:MAG: single-stranded-DNA-specific exonuclease RecJ [Chloroflexi bacterium]|nr:single-stranded-DNA-specific exonuclease RecJ [Chloroflexota bacterium]